MPGLVTSMDVAPPMRTENSGIRCVDNRFDLLPLGIIGIPFGFFFQRRLLAERRESDLASAIFNHFPPDFGRFETRLLHRLSGES